MEDKDLKKKLDNLAIKIIKEPNLAFIGSFLFNLEIELDKSVPTACTNGVYLKVNPDFFYNILSKEQRFFTIIHELWHIAKLHSLRMEDRDPMLWNMACDFHINWLIQSQCNRRWTVTPDMPKGCLYDEKYADMSEEEIYDELLSHSKEVPANYESDLVKSSKEEQTEAIHKVGSTLQMAKNQGVETAEGYSTFFTEFVKPKLNWRRILRKFCTEQLDKADYTWRRPNRRYPKVYMPSLDYSDTGTLTHLMYFLDVSGSISDDDIKLFNSEIKAIKENLNPDKLTLVQFDTKICRIDVFTKDMPFSNIEVVAGGGTSYEDVRNLILQEKPTAAIIFTDLCCSPMQEVRKIPVMWVTRYTDRRYRENPLFGKILEIKD